AAREGARGAPAASAGSDAVGVPASARGWVESLSLEGLADDASAAARGRRHGLPLAAPAASARSRRAVRANGPAGLERALRAKRPGWRSLVGRAAPLAHRALLRQRHSRAGPR